MIALLLFNSPFYITLGEYEMGGGGFTLELLIKQKLNYELII
jgi:hypothetical protein